MFKTIYDYSDFAQDETKADGSRVYVNAAGVGYPSATTVLGILNKDSINKWRERVGEEEANRVSKQATTRGSKIHSLTEAYLKNEEVDFDAVKASLLDKEMFNFGCTESTFITIVSIFKEGKYATGKLLRTFVS